MDTRPFLYIDLEKAWREELHPRDKVGKFTTVKGGSRVVTKQGKTGVVDKVTSTHYHITTEDGKKSKVLKENAIHATDHANAMERKKKEERAKKRKAKATAKKTATTKATNKANGTGKAKTVKDPTEAKKAPKKAATASKTATKKPVAKKPAATKAPAKKAAPKKLTAAQKKQGIMERPTLKRAKNQGEEPTKEIKQTVPKGTNTTSKPQKEQNQALQDFKTADKTMPKEQGVTIDSMWESPEVQKLMKQPPGKRNANKIREIAGKITEANDKLARMVANKRVASLGIGQSYNTIGNKATPADKVIKQETGLYGDILQSARGAMYETLLSTFSGSQTPGSAMGAHVVNRMKDKTRNDLYGFLNHIPAPHEMRPAIRDMKSAENELSQTLGRTPTHDEVANHLEAVSDHFRNASIPPAPKWDAKANDWVAARGKVEDPSERLALLKQYNSIQRTTSANSNVGHEGEREVTIAENAVDAGRSPEEMYERKERQKELEGTLPKAMRAMGMSDASIKVWSLTHSGTSGGRGQLKSSEVAEMINSQGGWEGKPITESWVRKHYSAGRKVIEEALKSNHPAIAQLAMLKSFVFNDMLRSVYEFNLIKSIYSWGMDETVLRDQFVRTDSAETLFEIRKSLAPTEYIGSYVVVDSGQVHARIVTHDIPRGEELTKAFQDFEELNKALFSHKDGGNKAVNEKAGAYVSKNKGKYKALANEQISRIKKKGGKLTWSEQLQIDKGGVWISWGGKRILIDADNGNILYDSKNEAHRDEQAEKHGMTNDENQLEFQHEADDKEEKSQALKEKAKKEFAEGKHAKSVKKWAETHGVKTKQVKDGKKTSTELDLDDEGNLQFDHDKMNFVEDQGAKAFEESIGDLKAHMSEHKKPAIEAHHHKAIGFYNDLSDEDKDYYDKLSPEDRKEFVGEQLSDKEGVRELLTKAKELMDDEGLSPDKAHEQLKDEFDAVGKATGSMALKNGKKMKTFMKTLQKHDIDSSEVNSALGAHELSRAKEEANKRLAPEGYYEIGNKKNGKSMVVKLGHWVDPKNGNYTSYVQEAFDPKTGKHFTTEDSENSWGQLGKELGLSNNSAEKFIMDANKPDNDAVMQAMDDNEAQELRKQTSLGMQDNMLHKDFKMVDQKRGKDGKVKSTTYAQDMPDGTQNVIEVDSQGHIKDQVMARLVGQTNRTPINSAEDLHNVLKSAVGNKIWVTAHAGSDVHIGDALGHHVQIMYDGKGAPRVVGGVYDGYRFMDTSDVPKGAVDAHTGEPIKALFKNGKLVNRKATNMNDVPIDKGNAVMFQDGDKWHKGKVRDIQDGKYQVVDSKGNLVGMFDKKELKSARAKGRTLSQSGQAVVKLAEDGTHRMDTSAVFKIPHNKAVLTRQELAENAKAEKTADLFKEALHKAKIKHAFDREGNLRKDLELNDHQHKELNKILGRSKAGREMMKQFTSSKMPELEMHVPEHLRADVEAEGVGVKKDGTARISTAKFEQMRDILGGVSLDHKAQEYLNAHFKRKDRTPKSVEQLKKVYQPSMAEGVHADYYRKQFNPDSFLMNPKQGLYGTQLEGLAHLVERGNAIAGHGMGTGKVTLDDNVA